MAEVKFTNCVFCDACCAVKATIDGDEARFEPASPEFPAICSKIARIDEYRLHPDRVTVPMKNVGERGEPVWEQVSWDEALDDIARRLREVADEYGPRAIAFFETPLNHGFGGITRRLANALGTPNYTSPVELCMGNTAQVHRAVYGWMTAPDWDKADCIVFFGQNRGPERWPHEYLRLKAALDRGAKLIVIDPRETETAALADYHLRIRYGTDAALALGWINVIIGEELYDADFVRESCIGFDELRTAVACWTPEAVAEVCGIDAELVRETARVYASSSASIVPWGATTDMQVNSTAAIQAQCILRAICGFLNVSEKVFGPPEGGRGVSQIADFASVDDAVFDDQLGADAHPLLTARASRLYVEALRRAQTSYLPDIMAESWASVPPALFAAMRGEGPYEVKAAVVAANNTVMSYAGQPGIVEAFMRQDLVVVFEHWITPTAQLADYVLPGDMWAERDALGPQYEQAPLFSPRQKVFEPVGQCRSWYDVVKGLADRLGLAERFPWATSRDLFDWQLIGMGMTFAEACAAAPAVVSRSVPALGSFVTPSGKVELASSVLCDLGFDACPVYREPVDPGAAKAAADGETLPYVVFAGFRETKSYNTNLHQIASLRSLEPEPCVFVNPADAGSEGIAEGDWVRVETAYGAVRLSVHVDDAQPAGTLRVPHGWWKPERPQGIAAGLSDAMLHNDGMLFPDDDWNLDPAQGLPNLRGGIHARIVRG